MNTVLLPTDFSSNSMNAIEYALKFYKDKPTRFILFNVFEEPKSSVAVMVNLEDKIKKNAVDDLRRFKTKVDAIIVQQDIHSCEMKTMPGPLVNSINHICKSENVNAIFMGTQGASGLQKSLIGSVTSKVIREIKHPIIAVPREATFKNIERIAFATDLEPLSDGSILQPLLDAVDNFSAELMVVNVHKSNQHIKDSKEFAESAKLHQMFNNLKNTFHYLESENEVSAIEQFVAEKNVNMLAMITRDHTFFNRLFNTSTVEKMSFLTRIPLFAIHN